MSEHGHDHEAQVRTYLTIFAALAMLTVLTVGTAYLNLPHGPGIVIALVIALAKVYLIGSFFMHLRDEGSLIRISLGICVGLILVLMVFVLPDIGLHELEEMEMAEKLSNNPYAALTQGNGEDGSAH